MQLKTFDTILTDLCDDFDSLISPRSIARTNTNIIYLMFKAIAKGMEVINNVCVTLNNKFNPAKCSEEDLDSVASLVGTERLQGSGSGLHILATNTTNANVTLLQGTYSYALDDDTVFEFEVLEDKVLLPSVPVTFIAMTQVKGQYPVTMQTDIKVTSDVTIPDGVTFSCSDNSSLLGTTDETDVEFRKRILETYDRQNSIVELETTLKNQPYIFDCSVKFNSEPSNAVYDDVTIPPYQMAIFYSGEPKNEVAEIVASKVLSPTVATNDSVAVNYVNSVFANGSYTVNLIPFKKTNYSANIIYKVNATYIDIVSAKQEIETYLLTALSGEVHKDYIREDDIYNLIESMNLTGLTILGVNLIQNGQTVDYVEVPFSRIPELTSVSFTEA